MKVSSIVLNYNSNSDLFFLIVDLLNQDIDNHTIIVVDNNSTEENVGELLEWKDKHFPSAISGNLDEVGSGLSKYENHRLIFILNNVNSGYSAGNNIGIKMADELNSDAAFIVNPDIRIDNIHYISALAEELFRSDKNSIVASRVVDLEGRDQSPMSEDMFWTECFWPLWRLPLNLKKPLCVKPISSSGIVKVNKVIGCAFLIDIGFLKSIHLFDEGTFLYCEEAILSSQIKLNNLDIVFIPSLKVLHTHKRSEKSDSSSRMLTFVKSRLYYIDSYSRYNSIQKLMLFVSYKILFFCHWFKLKLRF
jgi:GT2 family glycosyltransferase